MAQCTTDFMRLPMRESRGIFEESWRHQRHRLICMGHLINMDLKERRSLLLRHKSINEVKILFETDQFKTFCMRMLWDDRRLSKIELQELFRTSERKKQKLATQTSNTLSTNSTENSNQSTNKSQEPKSKEKRLKQMQNPSTTDSSATSSSQWAISQCPKQAKQKNESFSPPCGQASEGKPARPYLKKSSEHSLLQLKVSRSQMEWELMDQKSLEKLKTEIFTQIVRRFQNILSCFT